MSIRNAGSTFNAGTFAPKKYDRYTVEYADTPEGGYTATYRYYGGTAGALMGTVTLTFDSQGRDIEGVLS
jgi:hypothetical protein